MAKVIIYKADNLLFPELEDGEKRVCVIHTSAEALKHHTMEELAEKDVTHGYAYKIVEDTEIPTDRTFRNAWDIDDSELDGGVGSEHHVWTDDPAHPDYVEPSEGE